jgi:hypothetical protein
MFGPSKNDVWQPFASEIGAEFICKGWWAGGSYVNYQYKNWIITLDTFTYLVTLYTHRPTYTRLRTQFLTKDGLCFNAQRHSFFYKTFIKTSYKEVMTGFSNFDTEINVNGSDEHKIKELFSVANIRYLLLEIPEFDLEINTNSGIILKKDLPKGVCELNFKVPDVIKDTFKLRTYIDLYCELLDQLYKIGSAEEASPHI